MYMCQFEGFPLPNVTFYFNGAAISQDSGVTIISNNLIIPFPQVSHSGIYQCIVSNEFGDDQVDWYLEIRQPSECTILVVISGNEFHDICSVSPQVQPLNLTELDAVEDRDFGILIVRNNASILILSVNVLADPCPKVVWSFNGTALGPNNDTITYSNPCIAVGDRNIIWTYTLNVVLTLKTSGQYLANFTNIAGTAFLPKAYFTVPGMFI